MSDKDIYSDLVKASEQIHKEFEHQMLYDGAITSRQAGKTAVLTQGYGGQAFNWESFEGMWGHALNTKRIKQLGETCRAIEAGIRELHIPMPEHYREQIMELVIARIGLFCAHNNKKFDSFEFAASARNFARRGEGAKAARSARGLQRSKRR